MGVIPLKIAIWSTGTSLRQLVQMQQVMSVEAAVDIPMGESAADGCERDGDGRDGGSQAQSARVLDLARAAMNAPPAAKKTE
jgi:hypothetical protein